MSTEGQQATLEAYFTAINEERYADVAALFAPEGRLTAPGLPPRAPGEIADYLQAALRPYAEHHDDPVRTVHADGTATVVVEFTGALASGAPMAFTALDVFDFDAEGRIRELSTWYDSHVVRGRLAEAQALEDPAPPDRADAGGAPEATTARVRAALRAVRRGRAVRLRDARWRGLPPGVDVLTARAVVLQVAEPTPDAVEAALAAAGVRAGDAVLLRAGAGAAIPAAVVARVAEARAAALATDAAVAPDAGGIAVGEHWDLARALGERPPATCLLVSVPGTDGAADGEHVAANAVLWT